MSRQHQQREFRYWTRSQWEKDTPSRKDGLESKKERRFAKTCCEYVKETAKTLNMPQVAVATAMTMFHRYFAVRSMLRTDRFLVATAALFLAGKIEESPKALRDVLYLFFKYRFKKKKDLMAKFGDKGVYEEVKEAVLLIERLLLCVLGFEFNFKHPYPVLLKTWAGNDFLRKLDEDKKKGYVQLSWNFINDSFKGPMCLMYPPEDIAVAAIYTTLLLSAKRTNTPLLQTAEDGREWWADLVPKQQLLEVSSQLLKCCGYSAEALGEDRGDDATETAAGGGPSIANSNSEAAGGLMEAGSEEAAAATATTGQQQQQQVEDATQQAQQRAKERQGIIPKEEGAGQGEWGINREVKEEDGGQQPAAKRARTAQPPVAVLQQQQQPNGIAAHGAANGVAGSVGVGIVVQTVAAVEVKHALPPAGPGLCKTEHKGPATGGLLPQPPTKVAAAALPPAPPTANGNGVHAEVEAGGALLKRSDTIEDGEIEPGELAA